MVFLHHTQNFDAIEKTDYVENLIVTQKARRFLAHKLDMWTGEFPTSLQVAEEHAAQFTTSQCNKLITKLVSQTDNASKH